MAYTAADRRPIASRERRGWQAAARVLARAGVSANFISVCGLLTALAAGAAAVGTAEAAGWQQRLLWLCVAAGAQLRLLANMLDGMVAIESGTASPVGELYNEVPDRFSDAAVLIGVGYAAGGWVAMGYIAALLALLTAYVRATCRVAGSAQDYCGPMAKPHRMAVIIVAAVYLAVTPGTWHAAGDWGIAAMALTVVAAGSAVTCVRRLLRGASELRSKA
jgi:phosphatidylglycerophosphate synthase